MTTAAAAIVTALGEGPASARDLSQRLDGIGYANIRQALRRLASAGTVTQIKRGVYAAGTVDVDEGAPAPAPTPAPAAPAPAPAQQRHDTRPTVDWSQAMAGIMADFEAMNDPRDPRAWA